MKVVFRSMTTPDGTELISRYNWDYQSHKDKNGKIYAIDSGLSLVYKRLIQGDETIKIVFSTDDFEEVRKYMYRYNPNENKYITLKDISDDWLENIITWYLDIPAEKRDKQISWEFLVLFLREKQYRNIDLEIF